MVVIHRFDEQNDLYTIDLLEQIEATLLAAGWTTNKKTTGDAGGIDNRNIVTELHMESALNSTSDKLCFGMRYTGDWENFSFDFSFYTSYNDTVAFEEQPGIVKAADGTPRLFRINLINSHQLIKKFLVVRATNLSASIQYIEEGPTAAVFDTTSGRISNMYSSTDQNVTGMLVIHMGLLSKIEAVPGGQFLGINADDLESFNYLNYAGNWYSVHNKLNENDSLSDYSLYLDIDEGAFSFSSSVFPNKKFNISPIKSWISVEEDGESKIKYVGALDNMYCLRGADNFIFPLAFKTGSNYEYFVMPMITWKNKVEGTTETVEYSMPVLFKETNIV